MYHGRLFCEIQLMIRNNWPKIIFKRNWLQIFLGSSDLLFVWNLNLALFDDSCFWSLTRTFKVSVLPGLSSSSVSNFYFTCMSLVFNSTITTLDHMMKTFMVLRPEIKQAVGLHIISVHLQPPWQLMRVCLIL
jgi:hypothetical protein